MNATKARKIVKDNNLDVTIKARTNGLIYLTSFDVDDYDVFEKLLNKTGYAIDKSFGRHMIVGA